MLGLDLLLGEISEGLEGSGSSVLGRSSGLSVGSSLGLSSLLGLLLSFGLLGCEWVELVHDSSVGEWVDLSGVVVVWSGWGSNLILDSIGVDDSRDVSRSEDVSLEGVSRLLSRFLGVGSEYLIEGFEGRLGPYDHSSEVTTWSELE